MLRHFDRSYILNVRYNNIVYCIESPRMVCNFISPRSLGHEFYTFLGIYLRFMGEPHMRLTHSTQTTSSLEGGLTEEYKDLPPEQTPSWPIILVGMLEY